MPEKNGRMVNRRLGLVPAGEGENFISHLDQPSRHDRIVGASRQPSQVPCQGCKLAFDIFHCPGPHMKVTDSGVCNARDGVALI
jgi:hypothetical protein